MRLFDWGREEQAELAKAVQRLTRRRTPVTVQFEQINIQFPSVAVVKGNRLIVARPRKLEPKLAAGSWLRVYFASEKEGGIRAKVQSPLFILNSGNSVVIAELPEAMLDASARNEVRHDMTRYRGVRLAVLSLERQFALADLSRSGCRIVIDRGIPADLMPLGKPIEDAMLVLGGQRVRLQSLVPCVHTSETVGCTLTPASDGRSVRVFSHFLDKLDEAATVRYRVDPFV